MITRLYVAWIEKCCRQTRLMEVVRAQDLAVLRIRESTSDPVICTRGIRYVPSIVLPLSLYESETSIILAGNTRCFQKSGVFRSSLLIVRKHSMSLNDTRGGLKRRCARWLTCWWVKSTYSTNRKTIERRCQNTNGASLCLRALSDVCVEGEYRIW